MQLISRSLILALAGMLAGLAAGTARAQVTLTVTPSVISNTYPGFITVNITGLTNTEQVTLQRWLDANGNGTVDAGEPMMEAFKIKESGAMVFNGVTNVSAPYDSNSATDAITTKLNFGPPLPLMDIAGQQIFRVTSPTGRFSPVTATLTVTNAQLPQSVSGTVYSNGVAGLPYAMVVALSLEAGNNTFAGAAMADGTGHYYLTLPAGQYGLLGLYPGYYVDQNLAPSVTLTNGITATNDLYATNSTAPVIAGHIYDAANSNALGGVFIQATESGGSLFAIGFTDTNGDFSMPVTSNNWKLKLDGSQLAHRAYIVPENSSASVSTALGSVSNKNLALYKGNALYYGRFMDNLGAPLVNFSVVANDSSNQFKANGFTDANGYYGVVVLSTTNSPWYLSASGDNAGMQAYIVNTQQSYLTNGVSVATNDFSLLPVTAEISGRLTDNEGNPLPDIGISAYANIGADSYNTAFVDTDTNGQYSFGAADGTWYVFANEYGGHSLAGAGYYDPANNNQINGHVAVIPPTNVVVNLVVYPANLPQFGQAVAVSSSQFDFNLYGASGQNYTVQMSTNLGATNWQTIAIISNLPSSPYLIQDFRATNSAGYYRALKGP